MKHEVIDVQGFESVRELQRGLWRYFGFFKVHPAEACLEAEKNGEAVRAAMARLERIEAELKRVEAAVAGVGVGV